jgi:hypothetical protein
LPFALADLAAIAAALALLLFAVIVDWIVTKANSAVPTTSFPIVGDIFGWAHDWLGDLHNWVVDAEDAANTVLAEAITDAGWLLSRISGAVMQADGNLLTLVRHTANVVVVNAENAAKTFATDAANAVESVVHNQLVASVDNIEDSLGSLQDNIDRVIDTTIPNAVSSAFDRVESDLATDVTNLQNNITTVADGLAASVANLEATIGPIATAVFTTIPGELIAEAITEKNDNAATANQAQANLVTATQNLQSNLDQVQAEIGIQGIALQTANASIASLDTTAEDYGQQLANLNTDAATASSAIDSLTNQADGLKTQLTTAQGQINTLQQTEAITFPGLPDIAIPGSLTVPLAVGGLATVVADIATEIGECMVSVCDGPNNYANLLQGILGGIDLASMALFLGEAIKNPTGTAGTFAAVGEDLYNDADSFISELLSL